MIFKINTNTKMAYLVIAYPNMIAVLERLGIAFGFGDKSLQDIAIQYEIDTKAFLSILLVFQGNKEYPLLSKESIKEVIRFLRLSHLHFKEIQIPEIKDLISLFAESIPQKHAAMIISFFKGYIEEVSEHFLYEEETVFPYIDSVLRDMPRLKRYMIDDFEAHHTDIEQKLLDLKNILIKYIPSDINSPYRISILRHLIQLEEDLQYHSLIENHVLIPSVKEIENTSTYV